MVKVKRGSTMRRALILIISVLLILPIAVHAAPCPTNLIVGDFKNFTGYDIQSDEAYLEVRNLNQGTTLSSSDPNQVYIGSDYFMVQLGNAGDTNNNNCYAPGDMIEIVGYDNSTGEEKSVLWRGNHSGSGDFIVSLRSNEIPVLSSVSIDNLIPGTSSVVHCEYSGYADVFTPGTENNTLDVSQAQPEDVYYTWYATTVGEGTQTIVSKVNNNSLDIADYMDNLSVNDYINCSAIVSDSMDNSTVYYSSNAAQLQGSGASFDGQVDTNADPSNPVEVGDLVNFSAVANVDGGGNFSFHICAADVDNITDCQNNPDSQICSSYDNLDGALASCTHDTSADTDNASYPFKAFVCDVNDKCSSAQSSYHVNHEDTVTFDNPEIIPASPYTNDALECNYIWSSPVDGDNDDSLIRWFNSSDGVNFAFSGITSNAVDPTLDSQHTSLGQHWLCEVVPKDGHGLAGTAVNSTSAEILNSPPQVHEFYFGPDPAMNIDMPASGGVTAPDITEDNLNVSDPDGSASYTTAYKWYVRDDSGNVINTYVGQTIPDIQALGAVVGNNLVVSVDVCNEGTTQCSGYVNTSNQITLIGGVPYFVDTPSVDDNSSLDEPTNVGDNVNFQTLAKHPANLTYRLWVCKVNNVSECSSSESLRYCNSSAASGDQLEPEATNCLYETNNSIETEENYTYYAFVCDANAISMCSDSYSSEFHVNHHPIGFDQIAITPPNPDRASDITCGISGFNDPDWDDVQDAGASSTYSWYKAEGNVGLDEFPQAFQLQPSYTSGHLGNGVVQKNETWVCEVTPIDRHGLAAGTDQRERTYTINAVPRAQSLPEVYVIDAASTEANRSEGEFYYGDIIGVNRSTYSDPDLDPQHNVTEAPDGQDPASRPHAINWQISKNPGKGVDGQTDSDFEDITDNFDIENLTTTTGDNHGSVGDILRVCQGFYDGHDYNDYTLACSAPFALNDPGKVKPSWISTPVDSWIYNRTEEVENETGVSYIVDTSHDVPVIAGKDITFKASATHPDGQYDFIVCSNDSSQPTFNGVNFGSCSGKEYCREENVAAGETGKCSYTSKVVENEVHWKAFVCNRGDNMCNVDSSRSPFVVNHRPDLSVQHPAFYGGGYSNEDGYDIAVSPGEVNLTGASNLQCEFHLKGDHENLKDVDGDDVQLDRYVWYIKGEGQDDYDKLSFTGKSLPPTYIETGDKVRCSVKVYNHIIGNNGANVTVGYDVYSPTRLSKPVEIVPDTIRPWINSTFESFAYIPDLSNCNPLNPHTEEDYKTYPEFSVIASDNGNVTRAHATVYYPNGTTIDMDHTDRQGSEFLFSLQGYEFVPGDYEVVYYVEDSTGLFSRNFTSMFEVKGAKIISGTLQGLQGPINSTVELKRDNKVMHRSHTDGQGYYEVCVFKTDFDLQFDVKDVLADDFDDKFEHEIMFESVNFEELQQIPVQIEPVASSEVDTDENRMQSVVGGFAIKTTLSNKGDLVIGYGEGNVERAEHNLMAYSCRDWVWSQTVKKCNSRWKGMYTEVNTVDNYAAANMQGKPSENNVAFVLATDPKASKIKVEETLEPSARLSVGANFTYNLTEHGLNLTNWDVVKSLDELYVDVESPQRGVANKTYIFNRIRIDKGTVKYDLDAGDAEAGNRDADIVFDTGDYDVQTGQAQVEVSSNSAGVIVDRGVQNHGAFMSEECNGAGYEYEDVSVSWQDPGQGLVGGIFSGGEFGLSKEGTMPFANYKRLVCEPDSLSSKSELKFSQGPEVSAGSVICTNVSGSLEKMWVKSADDTGIEFLKGFAGSSSYNVQGLNRSFCVKSFSNEVKLTLQDWNLKHSNGGKNRVDIEGNGSVYLDLEQSEVSFDKTVESDLNYTLVDGMGQVRLQMYGGNLGYAGEFNENEFDSVSCLDTETENVTAAFGTSFEGKVYCLSDANGDAYKLRFVNDRELSVVALSYDINNTEWVYQKVGDEFELRNVSEGDYDFEYNVNFVNGSSRSFLRWMSVYNETNEMNYVQDSDGAGVPGSVNLYRPGEDVVAYSFVIDHVEGYNLSVSDRRYDVEMNFAGVTFKFFNVTTDQILDNIDVEELLSVDIGGINYNQFVEGFAVGDVEPVKARVTFYYDKEDDAIDNIADLSVFKCDDWSFGGRTCNSNWHTVGGGRLEQERKAYYVDVNSFSAYSLLEKTVSSEEQVGQSSSSNDDTSSGQLSSIYNETQDLREKVNKTQEMAEKSYDLAKNISKRQIKKVSIQTTEISKEMYPGESITTKLHIENNRETSIEITAKPEGDITQFFAMDSKSKRLSPGTEANLPITISVPKDTRVGLYSGWVVLEATKREKVRVPVEIRVVETQEKQLQLHVQTLESAYPPGKTLKLEVNMLNPQPEPLDVRLAFEIYKVDSGKVLLEKTVNTKVDTSVSEVVEFGIPEDVALGKYIIRLNGYYTSAKGQDMQTPASTFVNIAYPWYTHKLFGMLPIWMLSLILLGAMMLTGGYEYYEYRKDKNRKYQMIVNYSTLPQPSKKAAFVGHVAETSNRAFMNLEDLKTHTIVAGATGGGKSVAAQVIVEEALKKGVSVIVFDPTAQWTGFLRRCKEKRMLKYYPKFGLKRKEAKAFSGNIHAIENAREKIDIKKFIKPGEITVFTTNKLEPKDVDILIANTVRQVFRSNLEESAELKLLLVYDEVHRLLPKYGGSGAGFLQIERGCREFRKWGVGLVLISQVLSDFVGTIKANISNEIQVRTRDESDLERLKLKYGDEILKSVVKASVGTAMYENAQYNKGRAYFIDFRPLLHSVTRLSDDELEKYNKYNEIIDDLGYQLDQLEQDNVDVFDLRLELKLATDKVKTGNFNMVDIYLEGLKPRIQEQWTKLGKQPKKKEKELVSEEEIQESIREAQKTREEYQKKQKQLKEGKPVTENTETSSQQDKQEKRPEGQGKTENVNQAESSARERDIQALKQYVEKALQRKLKLDDIKQQLAKQGWKQDVVEKAISEVSDKQSTDTKTGSSNQEKTQANNSQQNQVQSSTASKAKPNAQEQQVAKLRKVVQQVMAKGYSKEQIRQMLLKKGWNKQIVDEVMQDNNK